tara:strand:- start:146 stop:295 length:150 start_codon:yes stop_codon:yes gene_type:complete
MIKKIIKKGTKKVNPSDSDPAKYIRDNKGSGVDKKLSYDYFSKDNDYPV